jgi:hypothetical protein
MTIWFADKSGEVDEPVEASWRARIEAAMEKEPSE